MVDYHQPKPKGQIHYTVLKEKENKNKTKQQEAGGFDPAINSQSSLSRLSDHKEEMILTSAF